MSSIAWAGGPKADPAESFRAIHESLNDRSPGAQGRLMSCALGSLWPAVPTIDTVVFENRFGIHATNTRLLEQRRHCHFLKIISNPSKPELSEPRGSNAGASNRALGSSRPAVPMIHTVVFSRDKAAQRSDTTRTRVACPRPDEPRRVALPRHPPDSLLYMSTILVTNSFT